MNRFINPVRWLISAGRFNFLLLLLALLATTARAQIAILDGNPLTSQTVAANTINYPSFTVSPGASVLIVCLEDKNQNLPEPTTLAWIGGQTLTRDVQTAHAATTSRSLAIYHLFNPTPGTAAITGTMTKTVNQVWMTAYTLTGVDTTVAPIVGSTNSGAGGPTGGSTGAETLAVNLTVKGGSWAAVNTTCANSANTIVITSSAGAVTTITDYLDGGTGIAAGYAANLTASLAGSPVTFTYKNGGDAGLQKANFAVVAFTPLVLQTYPPAIGVLSPDAKLFTSGTASMSAQIWGTPPLSYQWYTNNTTFPLSSGGNLTSTTNSVLTISNTTLANAGNYILVATNVYGAVTSSVVNLSFITPNDYERAALSNNPVAIYTFGSTSDPSTGNAVAYDGTGLFNGLYSANVLNGFNGILGPQATADNLPGFPDGNLAVHFNGAANGAVVGSADQEIYVPALNMNTNTFTFVAWINPPAAQVANAAVVALHSSTSTAILGFAGTAIGGQIPLAYSFSNVVFSSTLTVPLNSWSLVAVAVSPTNAGIYLITTHGPSSATITSNQIPANFNSRTTIGFNNTVASQVFKGTIDDVTIFNSTLSQSQMLGLYAAASHQSYFPAAIVSQPLPQNLYAGNKVARFTVVAAGSPTITYQWYKNSTPLANGLSVTGSTIAGATNATLTVSNLFAGDAGNYYVQVSNLSGPVFSSTNPLTIIAPIGNAYETALLAAGPLAHYELDETADPSTNNTLAYDYVGGYNGIYGTVAQNGYDGVQGPQPSTGLPGFTSTNLAASFGADANSVITLPPWNLSTDTNTWTGTTLAAWINPYGTENNGAGIVMTRAPGNTCGINYINFLGANNNRIMGYSWNNDNSATWSWNSGLTVPPSQWSLVVLTVTPTNATIYVINTNSFNAATHVLAHVPMAFNGSTMIGQGQVASASSAFSGTIDDVAVFSKPLTSDQVLALFTNASGVTGFAPSISVPPTNALTVYKGYDVQLPVVAGGTQPLVYQWMAGAPGSGIYTNLFNAGNISGSTSTTLTISNINLAQTADYILVLTNMYGSLTSSVAALTVNDSGPFVVTDTAPNPATYYAGFPVTFTAAFDGSRPIAYQWVTDGGSGTFTNVPGATSSTLVISNVQAGNAGNYKLQASNLAGTGSSSQSTLTVVDSTYAIHFSATNAITTADATLNHPGVVTGAAVFGGTAEVVTLGNGSSLTFTANGSVASVTPGNTGAFAYPSPNTTGNANFDAVLNQCSADLGPKTITLNNLVAGHNYSVLLTGLDARGLPSVAGSAPARFAYFQDPVVATDVSSTFQMGQNVYVMASFLAQTTTQTIIEQLPTGNNGNMNALVVYDLSAVVTAPTLNVTSSSGGNLTLTWSGGATLLQTTNLVGPWTTNSTATSPYTISPTNAQKFFRVRIP